MVFDFLKQTNWKILVAYTAHKIVNSVESMQGWRLYRISNNTYSFRRKQEVSCKHKEQVSFLLFRWQILKVYTLLLRFHLAVNRGTAWVGLLESYSYIDCYRLRASWYTKSFNIAAGSWISRKATLWRDGYLHLKYKTNNTKFNIKAHSARFSGAAIELRVGFISSIFIFHRCFI